MEISESSCVWQCLRRKPRRSIFTREIMSLVLFGTLQLPTTVRCYFIQILFNKYRYFLCAMCFRWCSNGQPYNSITHCAVPHVSPQWPTDCADLKPYVRRFALRDFVIFPCFLVLFPFLICWCIRFLCFLAIPRWHGKYGEFLFVILRDERQTEQKVSWSWFDITS